MTAFRNLCADDDWLLVAGTGAVQGRARKLSWRARLRVAPSRQRRAACGAACGTELPRAPCVRRSGASLIEHNAVSERI